MIDARKPVVDRMSGGVLRIRWDNPDSDEPVRVYAGTDPDAIARTDVVGNLENGELIFPDHSPGTRRFFELVSAAARYAVPSPVGGGFSLASGVSEPSLLVCTGPRRASRT